MKSVYVVLLATVGSGYTATTDGDAHGEDAEGTIQGPVAFLWPEDRPWSTAADNIGPCGSSNGVSNRTEFPLSQGSVALAIADEAWNVAFSVAYVNNPTTQNQFSQQVVGVPVVDSGHQCYKIAEVPDTVVAGSNATIQLEYWSNMVNELGGRNQSFFACADITFVDAADFTAQVPCFNVTSSDFDLPESSSTSTAEQPDDADSKDSSSGGLAAGAIAGIVVGVVVASLLVIGSVAFVVFRRRGIFSGSREQRSFRMKGMAKTASIGSGDQ